MKTINKNPWFNSSLPIDLKLDKPQVFCRKRDFLVVNILLYKAEKCSNLIQLAHGDGNWSDKIGIFYATTLFIDIAAVWRYTLLKAGASRTTWERLVAVIPKEFVTDNHEGLARDV